MNTSKQQLQDFLAWTLNDLVRQGAEFLPLAADQVATDFQSAAVSDAVVHSPDIQNDSIAQLAADLDGCVRCKLSQGRKNIVISRGNPKANLMFIGEGPGRDEDIQGKPFVGRAGQLLDKIIAAMGFSEDEVYIANIVKCRPPQNRNPEDDEVDQCLPFLHRQIALVRPQVICLLGGVALKALLGKNERISRLRGKFLEYQGVPTMPTFHPAFLLRNPEMKRAVWEDVQKICDKLGRPVPAKKKG